MYWWYQMLMRMQRNWIIDTLPMGIENVKWYSHLENSLAVSLKTKYIFTIWPSNFTPGHLSKRNENLHPHKNLYTYIHSSIICNSPNLETTIMSLNKWMFNQNLVIYTMEYLSAIKNEWAIFFFFNFICIV